MHKLGGVRLAGPRGWFVVDLNETTGRWQHRCKWVTVFQLCDWLKPKIRCSNWLKLTFKTPLENISEPQSAPVSTKISNIKQDNTHENMTFIHIAKNRSDSKLTTSFHSMHFVAYLPMGWNNESQFLKDIKNAHDLHNSVLIVFIMRTLRTLSIV